MMLVLAIVFGAFLDAILLASAYIMSDHVIPVLIFGIPARSSIVLRFAA